MEQIILASNSPRRKLLLEKLGLPFEIKVSGVDEDADDLRGLTPSELVKVLSEKKARVVLEAEKAEADAERVVIIGADTIVVLDDKIIGKPEDARDAFDILNSLQGRTHTVYTGVTLIRVESGKTAEVRHIIDSADVTMRDLTNEEISAYISTGEPFDKAGAYGVQEKGMLLVEKINGDYNTVVGLPVVKVYQALIELGFDVTKVWKKY